MASHTFLSGMSTCQFKIRQTVVKPVCLPPGYIMTSLTGLIGIIFFIDISHMNVFMAINASFTDIPETPPCRLLMTRKTRGGQMGTFQLKISLIMFFNRIRATAKVIDGMTFRTIRTYTVPDKFSSMVIAMA